MARGLVVTGLGNQIEWASHNGKGLITGKREVVTQEAIKAVMEHMYVAHGRSEKSKERGFFAYKVDGFGELRFYPVEGEE